MLVVALDTQGFEFLCILVFSSLFGFGTSLYTGPFETVFVLFPFQF